MPKEKRNNKQEDWKAHKRCQDLPSKLQPNYIYYLFSYSVVTVGNIVQATQDESEKLEHFLSLQKRDAENIKLQLFIIKAVISLSFTFVALNICSNNVNEAIVYMLKVEDKASPPDV